MGTSIPDITVIIPCRVGESADITLNSLANQTYKGFKVVVVHDTDSKGAPWARNEGFKQCDTPFVLFSDNDIDWKPHALETMRNVLERFPDKAYTYGRFMVGPVLMGHRLFDPARLVGGNYVTTMSLLRSADFHGFDESLKRLQDWDLWLTLLVKYKKRGVYCNDFIFTTEVREGLTLGNPVSEWEARQIILKKHGLPYDEFEKKQ